MSALELQPLAQALSVVGLALGTIGYGLLMRRRRDERIEASATAASGLQGLVRVMLRDD